MSRRKRQPNLLKAFRRALDDDPNVNPELQDGEFTYMKDVGVIFRCLLAKHTDMEIIQILDQRQCKGSAYVPALQFLRDVADRTAKE